MHFLIIIFLSICIAVEFIFINYYRTKAKRTSLEKISTPCGHCFRESAYQKVQDRKATLKTAYILYNEIPAGLYSSHRKCAIAEEACKKFYCCLKDNLEKI
jgi:hypothetical protein